MRWPFGRSRSDDTDSAGETAGASGAPASDGPGGAASNDHGVASAAPSSQGVWRSFAPMTTSLPVMRLTTEDFAANLASWQSPVLSDGGLGHRVDPNGPCGVLPVVVARQAEPTATGGSEALVLRQRQHASATAAPALQRRRWGGSGGHAATPADPEPTAAPVSHAGHGTTEPAAPEATVVHAAPPSATDTPLIQPRRLSALTGAAPPPPAPSPVVARTPLDLPVRPLPTVQTEPADTSTPPEPPVSAGPSGPTGTFEPDADLATDAALAPVIALPTPTAHDDDPPPSGPSGPGGSGPGGSGPGGGIGPAPSTGAGAMPTPAVQRRADGALPFLTGPEDHARTTRPESDAGPPAGVDVPAARRPTASVPAATFGATVPTFPTEPTEPAAPTAESAAADPAPTAVQTRRTATGAPEPDAPLLQRSPAGQPDAANPHHTGTSRTSGSADPTGAAPSPPVVAQRRAAPPAVARGTHTTPTVAQRTADTAGTAGTSAAASGASAATAAAAAGADAVAALTSRLGAGPHRPDALATHADSIEGSSTEASLPVALQRRPAQTFDPDPSGSAATSPPAPASESAATPTATEATLPPDTPGAPAPPPAQATGTTPILGADTSPALPHGDHAAAPDLLTGPHDRAEPSGAGGAAAIAMPVTQRQSAHARRPETTALHADATRAEPPVQRRGATTPPPAQAPTPTAPAPSAPIISDGPRFAPNAPTLPVQARAARPGAPPSPSSPVPAPGTDAGTASSTPSGPAEPLPIQMQTRRNDPTATLSPAPGPDLSTASSPAAEPGPDRHGRIGLDLHAVLGSPDAMAVGHTLDAGATPTFAAAAEHDGTDSEPARTGTAGLTTTLITQRRPSATPSHGTVAAASSSGTHLAATAPTTGAAHAAELIGGAAGTGGDVNGDMPAPGRFPSDPPALQRSPTQDRPLLTPAALAAPATADPIGATAPLGVTPLGVTPLGTNATAVAQRRTHHGTIGSTAHTAPGLRPHVQRSAPGITAGPTAPLPTIGSEVRDPVIQPRPVGPAGANPTGPTTTHTTVLAADRTPTTLQRQSETGAGRTGTPTEPFIAATSHTSSSTDVAPHPPAPIATTPLVVARAVAAPATDHPTPAPPAPPTPAISLQRTPAGPDSTPAAGGDRQAMSAPAQRPIATAPEIAPPPTAALAGEIETDASVTERPLPNGSEAAALARRLYPELRGLLLRELALDRERSGSTQRLPGLP